MTFNHFNSLPVKVRIDKIQQALIIDGYYDLNVTGKRDKPTVKALQDFQKKNGLTPNAVISEATFNLLTII